MNNTASCIPYIYNLSMETGIFPDNFNTAKVIPAYKKVMYVTVYG